MVSWPTKIHDHICHILKPKIKRPVFRKLSVMNLFWRQNFKRKTNYRSSEIKNLKYDKNFQLTIFF